MRSVALIVLFLLPLHAEFLSDPEACEKAAERLADAAEVLSEKEEALRESAQELKQITMSYETRCSKEEYDIEKCGEDGTLTWDLKDAREEYQEILESYDNYLDELKSAYREVELTCKAQK